ncbi:MAG: hypothetical protein LBH06_04870, partial [Rikenellaceae bacterium]|nr:hypothetical protein [Rikenellaceae bacterium]
WLAENHGNSILTSRMFDLPPTCETYCEVGNALTECGEYGRAEHYYRTAAAMIPLGLEPIRVID